MDPRAFKKPKRIARPPRPKCDICGIACISTTMLKNHRSRHTPEEIANPQPAVNRHVDTATAAAVEQLLAKRKKAIEDALGSVRSVVPDNDDGGNGDGSDVPVRTNQETGTRTDN